MFWKRILILTAINFGYFFGKLAYSKYKESRKPINERVVKCRNGKEFTVVSKVNGLKIPNNKDVIRRVIWNLNERVKQQKQENKLLKRLLKSM